MRPVTAVVALRSLKGRALFIVLLATFAVPLPSMAGPAGQNELVNVIVSFRGHPREGGRQAVKEAGGQILRTFKLVDAVSARLPRGQMAVLERRAAIKAVELDHRLVAFDHAPATGNAELEAAWGVEHIGAGQVHAAGNTGAGVKVGVIDSGIDCSHPDLNDVCVGGWDFFNNDADAFDDNGHGTHVAGSLAAELNDPPAGVVGVAPDVDLYAYKVLDATGNGEYSGLIAALERAATVDRVDVVNMSLGAHEPSEALQDAVSAAYAAGVVLVAASGNVDPLTGEACPVAFPAAYEEVFSTSFTGPDDALTGYSCTGPELDFASPGDFINSTVPTGTCMFCAPSGYRGDMSGTSMASPHLAGTVALVLSNGITNAGDPATLADDVKAHLCSNTAVGTGVTYFGFYHVPISATDPRYPEWFGCGVLDANKALITNPPPTGGDPINHAPVATSDAASVTEDGSVAVDVLANDSDADDDVLSVTSVTTPAHGSAGLDASGNVVYTPAANYFGSDSFTYVVSDGDLSDSAPVSITVTPVNDAPVAADDAANTAEGASVTVDVLANDIDLEGDQLTVTAAGQPAHGTASLVSGGVRYTPEAGFSGSDSFTYTVSDGAATDSATVSVTIAPGNHPPLTNTDSASTSEARPVTINVLANDTDPDGDALTLSSVTPPAHGTASVDGGNVVYSPAPTYSGPDSFTYNVTDGQGGTATGTVNVSVSATPRQMHVGDLDATATRQTRRWTAKVTIRIRNSTGGAVSNVVVTGTWSTGHTVSCTTGSGGNCTLTRKQIGLSRTSVTFQVTNATRSGWLYLASANTDPDGDSDGTSIVVSQP